jgi:radical SAM protein with 4Fe4S-binding SPASM domain
VNLAEELAVALPEELQVELVGAGRSGPGRSPAFMSYDAFVRLAGQFPALKKLRLQGAGDPLLHPRFLDMVRHAARTGAQVSALTALPPLSPARAEELCKSPLQYLDIVFPPGGGTALFVRDLDRLVQAKKTAGAVLPWLRLAVPLPRVEEIADALRFARDHQLDAIALRHLPQGRKQSRAPKDLDALLDQAAALADELGVRLDLPERKPTGRCDSPWRAAHVGYYGRARPCAMVTALDRVSFGNMARDPVVRVWNSDEYRAFRDRLASPNPPEVCRGCGVYQGTC